MKYSTEVRILVKLCKFVYQNNFRNLYLLFALTIFIYFEIFVAAECWRQIPGEGRLSNQRTNVLKIESWIYDKTPLLNHCKPKDTESDRSPVLDLSGVPKFLYLGHILARPSWSPPGFCPSTEPKAERERSRQAGRQWLTTLTWLSPWWSDVVSTYAHAFFLFSKGQKHMFSYLKMQGRLDLWLIPCGDGLRIP